MSVAPIVSFNEVLGSDHVPSLPEVALRIIDIAQQPDPDMQELIRTVRVDPAIAGRVLKFANSALFGLRTRPSSIEAAVPMLGTTLVRTLVLGFSLSRHTAASDSLKPWFAQLWRAALFQASAAEFLAEKSGGEDAPTWFLAGLLQDVGRIALLNVAQTDYVEAVLQLESDFSCVERELDHFGFSHVDVSVALCQRWNLESSFVSAIADHHKLPSDVTAASRKQLQFGLATASACSEYLDAIGDRLSATRTTVERLLIEGYDFLPDDVQARLAEMDARSIALAGGFSINVGNAPSRAVLLARAKSVLRQIAMENQLQLLNGAATDGSEKNAGNETLMEEWLDGDTQIYSRRYLDNALPRELEKSHLDGKTVGLLKIQFPVCGDTQNESNQTQLIIDTVLECVRPTDSVIRTGDDSAVVILPGLNFDVLQRIAERIQEQLNEQLQDACSEDQAPSVGGVVVVPVGRKAAVADKVLDTLCSSAETAKSLTSSSRIAFQMLMGKKTRVLETQSTDTP